MARLRSQGDAGPDVAIVQTMLNRTGLDGPSLQVDGILEPRTKAKVVEFQRQHNLKPDGIVGPDTGAVLAANHLIVGAELKSIEAKLAWFAAAAAGQQV